MKKNKAPKAVTTLRLRPEDISTRRILDRRVLVLGAALGATALPVVADTGDRKEDSDRSAAPAIEDASAFFDDYARSISPRQQERSTAESHVTPAGRTLPPAGPHKSQERDASDDVDGKLDEVIDRNAREEAAADTKPTAEADYFDDYARSRFRDGSSPPE